MGKTYHVRKINPKFLDAQKKMITSEGKSISDLKIVKVGLVDYVWLNGEELIPVEEFFQLERREK